MIFWCKHLDPRLLAIRMVIGGRKLGSLEIGSKTVIFFIPSYALCLASWKQHPTILAQTPRSPYHLIEPNLAPLAHRTWRRTWLSLRSLFFFFFARCPSVEVSNPFPETPDLMGRSLILSDWKAKGVCTAHHHHHMWWSLIKKFPTDSISRSCPRQ